MDAAVVQGLVNELVYAALFAPNLKANAKVDEVVESIRAQRNFRHSPAEYAQAISAVVRAGHLPSETVSSPIHQEDEILDWLALLGQRLNAG